MAPSQHQYIALLRAINVGGNSIIKMADLKKLFESAGLSDVSTYIQTGNVLFKSSESNPEALARRLEKKIESSMGHDVTVFVLTPEQLNQAATHNPFDPERLGNEQRCHLMFMSKEPDADHKKKLMAMQGKEYRFAFWKKVFYLAYSRAFEGPKRRTINFEKVLDVVGTARSWKVVDKLIELVESQYS